MEMVLTCLLPCIPSFLNSDSSFFLLPNHCFWQPTNAADLKHTDCVLVVNSNFLGNARFLPFCRGAGFSCVRRLHFCFWKICALLLILNHCCLSHCQQTFPLSTTGLARQVPFCNFFFLGRCHSRSPSSQPALIYIVPISALSCLPEAAICSDSL